MLLMRMAVPVFVTPCAACDQAAEAPANTVSTPPPAVTVVSLQPTEITPGFGFNGRVVAVDEVQLRARVAGFLEQRLFEEGKQVLAVPQGSVQLDQAGPYVLVVGGGDGKVKIRRITLGDEAGTQVVIRDGLQQGERVIVEGIQKVRPGMVVAVSEAAAMSAGQKALQPRSGPMGPEWTIASVRPIVVHPADESCASQGIGCADDPLVTSERVSGTGAMSVARAAGAL